MVFNPHFYLLRLRHASLMELVCRLRQSLVLVWLKLHKKSAGHFLKAPEVQSEAIRALLMPDLNLDENNPLYNGIVKEPFSPWAPFTIDTECASGMRFDESEASETDIRMLWEPARLQQAVLLLVFAQHYQDHAVSVKAKQAAKTIVFSWLKANPFARGIHYKSAMECALRVPVFFYALKLLGDLTSDEYDLILAVIYRHAWLISNQLSLYSSLGNHTVTEAVGLVFAGAIFRSHGGGRRWLETGLRLLDDELPHQILDDGGPAEQSLNYHRFVLDLYWLAMDFIHKNNLGSVIQWKKRLSSGEFFLTAFQHRGGFFPSIGDSDDGFAIAPGISPARHGKTSINEKRVTFKNSGYSIIGENDLVFTFNHGPLGMPPFYNHGHADALSITLSKNGHPLLVDPGTYRYNGVPNWRCYFKGTRAHNTVTIDDQDQAFQETSFIWSRPYKAELTAYFEEDGQLFYTAVHDGYTRLKDPVVHRRSVLGFDRENFLIKDRFIGLGVHRFQLNFHLHPNAVATKSTDGWVVDHGGAGVHLRLFEGEFQVVRGQENPLLGWFSTGYGEKVPTSTLTFTRTGNADEVFFTTAICTLITTK